jgi:ABC-type sugar transport system substrate-binding protein
VAVEKLIETANAAHPDTGICFLNGPQGESAADALGEFIGSDSPNMLVCFSDWTFTGGRERTAEFIKDVKTIFTDISITAPGAVISVNASMASGAARAVSDAKLKKSVDVYALNPSGLNADMITSGKVAIAAVPDADAEARAAADICASLIENKEVSLNNLIPFIMIDKDNIAGYEAEYEAK